MTNEPMKQGDTALTLQMKEELKNLEEERRKRMEEKGQRPFFQWVKGDNYFQVNPDVPMRLEQGKFGEQAIFRVKANDGKEYDLAVGKHSPLYALLVRRIAKKQFNFAIIKSGIGKETRYEEKEIEY